MNFERLVVGLVIASAVLMLIAIGAFISVMDALGQLLRTLQ